MEVRQPLSYLKETENLRFSLLDLVTGYGLDDSGSESQDWQKIFFSSATCPTQLLLPWVPTSLPEAKKSRHEADRSTPSEPRLRKGSAVPICLYAFMA